MSSSNSNLSPQQQWHQAVLMYAERINRYYDYKLYTAPLKRLLYVVAVLAPMLAAAAIGYAAIDAAHGWKVTHGFAGAASGVTTYVMGTLVLTLPTVILCHEQLFDTKFITRRRKLLLVAYLPLTLLAMLCTWIMVGHSVPEWWKDG